MPADQENQPRRTGTQEQSFPLISVIQLVTFFVAFVVCIDARGLTQRLSEVDRYVLSVMIGIALLAGLLGMIIGASQLRMWSGMLLCGFIGICVGLLMIATYVAPAPPYQAICAVLVPIVTTVLIRFRSS